jgi:hypothetical protein
MRMRPPCRDASRAVDSVSTCERQTVGQEMGGTVALRGGGALLGGHVVVVASPSIVPWQLLDYLVRGQQITIATMILTVDAGALVPRS